MRFTRALRLAVTLSFFICGSNAFAGTIAAGGFHSLAVAADGNVWAWGWNNAGQLGIPPASSASPPVQVSGVSDVVAVSAGAAVSYALTRSGVVYGWGSSIGATPVAGLGGVAAISAGHDHALALKNDGTLWAWGINGYGQLGNGSTSAVFNATPVQVMTDVLAMSAGTRFSLAVKSDGSVWAWGVNNFGLLGTGATGSNVLTPTRIPGLDAVTAVAAGRTHALALKSNGEVWAWGSGGTAAANGAMACVPSFWGMSDLACPAIFAVHRVQTPEPAVSIASGNDYGVATGSDGAIWVWGELNPLHSMLPYRLPFGAVSALGTGSRANHLLAILPDGTVQALGDNSTGQLGTGSTAYIPANRPVHAWTSAGNLFSTLGATISPVGEMAIAAPPSLPEGGQTVFTASLAFSDGVTREVLPAWTLPAETDPALATLLATGRLFAGFVSADTAVTIGASLDAGGVVRTASAVVTIAETGLAANAVRTRRLAAGLGTSFGVKADGSAWGWGRNVLGELGNGSQISRPTPMMVSDLAGVAAVSATESVSLALKQDGTLWGWGGLTVALDASSNLVPQASPVPVQLSRITDVTAIAAQPGQILALQANGMVRASSTQNTTLSPFEPWLTGMRAIAGGSGNAMLGLRVDGTVWSLSGFSYTGEGGAGMLGTDGDYRPVAGLTDVVAIEAGKNFSLALKADGTVWAWGSNRHGELGGGTATYSTVPVPVPGLADVVAISATGLHALALKADGTVIAWGGNDAGQAGIGGFSTSVPPRPVVGLSGGVEIAAGTRHSLARLSDGSVWAWGSNADGELGLFGITESPFPVRVESRNGLGYFSATGPDLIVIQLAISGPQSVPEFSSALYTASATFSDGTTGPVAAQWSVTGPAVINAGGQLFTQSVASDTPATLSATYSVAGTTRSALYPITIVDAAAGRTLASLQITGPAQVNESSTAIYVAQATYSDGSSATVAPSWTLGGRAASISADGTLTSASVSANESVTVAAAYAEGGVTRVASRAVTVVDLGAANEFRTTLASGWNLLANTFDAPIEVAAHFGTQAAAVPGVTARIASVWAWDATAARWSFFSPLLSAAENAAHAAGQGYGVLATLQPGQGYWVNAIDALALPSQSGAAFDWSSSRFAEIPGGWNLLGQGVEVSPSGFNLRLNRQPPQPENVPSHFVSLWAWDAPRSQWFFYSPLLEAQGGMEGVRSYAMRQGYLHFADDAKLLGHGTGFWVMKP